MFYTCPILFFPLIFFFFCFFLIGKKNYIKKTARSKIATVEQKNKKKESKNKKKKHKLQRKRAKEKRKRVTRCESPNPSPIKQGTRKDSKQMVLGSIQILKRPPIAFLPNTPHQTQQN